MCVHTNGSLCCTSKTITTSLNMKKVKVLVAQSCPPLCDPIDCSLLGSSVHGISQTRILEWVAISFSRESSRPRNQTHVSCIGRLFISEPPGKSLSNLCARKMLTIGHTHQNRTLCIKTQRSYSDH